MSAPDAWMVIKFPLTAEYDGKPYHVGTLTCRADGTGTAVLDEENVRALVQITLPDSRKDPCGP